MPRYNSVVSDEDEDEDDDVSEVGDASPQLCTLVEALELAMRNVPLHGQHLTLANAELANLQTKSSTLFYQAVSPRWPCAFVSLLKSARMARVRFLFGDDPKLLLRAGAACHMCGTSEHRCQVALDLLAGDDGGVGSCEGMADMAAALDRRWDFDNAPHDDAAFLGTFVGGRRCFDLAMAAILAKNLLSDTAYEILQALNERLAEPGVLEALEMDERDATRPLFALTDVKALAGRLEKRVKVVESVLCGRAYPDSAHSQTGSAACWVRLRDSLRFKFGDDAERLLRFCGARASLSLGWHNQDEDDEDEELAPPPVSSRTRAGNRSAPEAPEAPRARDARKR